MSSIGAHLSPTAEEIFNLRHIARGTHAPTQIIRHGTILSLHTGELLERDVVISGRHIAAVTPWDYFAPNKRVQDGTSPHEGGEGAEIVEIEARGQFISPGFIDTHIHIEYTKLTPGELARLSVPRGTTTVLADANCIANVLGGRGMDFMGVFHPTRPRLEHAIAIAYAPGIYANLFFLKRHNNHSSPYLSSGIAQSAHERPGH